MTENKNEDIAAMQKIARGIQRLLSQYGDPIAMGTEPSVVVFQANAIPGELRVKWMWHAAIVYRQHVAPTPEVALTSLANTITAAAVRLSASNDGEQVPVKELPGGVVLLPDVWE